jgi:AcrR family transcriptional regulator
VNTGEPRRHSTEQRREEIIDAAVSLFCEKGYEGTTIRDIARAVGVTEGLLYHYFAGKAELVEACWRERSWHPRALALLERAGNRPIPGVIADLVRDQLRTLYENGPSVRMHAAEMLRDGELAAMSQNYIHETRTVLAEYLRRRQTEGHVRPDVDPEVVAHVIISTNITFFVVHGRLPGDEWERLATHLANEFTRLLARSLTCPDVSEASQQACTDISDEEI